ncbi:MAG: 1-deoxy-D-xylulose-5-phosphate synthase, partial [Deltaproteobacteria bacterium]|nr:1-deoxy-D-xylulose-5-phosphate synthase [Deltaproteobacteria bacterium]
FVVLNDNAMSIAPKVGAFSSFLSRRMTRKRIVDFKKDLENFIKSLPGVGENILNFARKSEDSFLAFFTPGMMFEAFKFKYIGPIQGHRLDRLIETFRNTDNLEGPILIHVLTVKGKGYEFAEKDPAYFHGVGSFDIQTGAPPVKIPSKTVPSYTGVFGKTMMELAGRNDRLFAITAAMPEGTGLTAFSKEFPRRFLDVGIAEQHAVTFAAGLATEGFHPVVAIYSTFLQRAFDQIIHDVCLPNLPVVFALDRGGVVGEDGPTHHGQFDVSYLRSLPNMTIMAPKDENELRHMLFTALHHNGPVAIRYPRGSGLGVPLDEEFRQLPMGEVEILKDGKDLQVLALGSMVYPSLEAARLLEAEGISAGVLNCRFAKPLDMNIAAVAAPSGRLLVIEENVRMGGLGGGVLELFNDMGVQNIQVRRMGLPDLFVEQGPAGLLRKNLGLDVEGIVKEARDFCQKA